MKGEFLGNYNLNFNYFYIFFLNLLFKFAIVLTTLFLQMLCLNCLDRKLIYCTHLKCTSMYAL